MEREKEEEEEEEELIKYGYGIGGHRVTPGLQGTRAHQCASAAPLCFSHKQVVAVLRNPKATEDPGFLEPDHSPR